MPNHDATRSGHELRFADDDDHFESDPVFIPPPRWPKFVGIVSIALGGFGLVCGGLGLVATKAFAGMIEPQLEGAPMPPHMVFGTVDYAIAAVGLLISIVLVAGGIALVGRRPVGRTLHLAYAIPALPLNIANMILTLDKQAAAVQWAKDYPDNPIAQSMNNGATGQQIGNYFTICLFVVLGIALPLFYFVWFMLVKTRAEQITGTEEGVV